MKKTNHKIIIGITSKIAGGKGTVAKYIQQKYNTNIYRFSTMLRDVLGRLNLDISRENMQKLSALLRKNFSEDLMAKVIAEDVKKDKNKIIVVEGIRRMADIKYLKKMPNFILVAIEAKPRIRYERVVKRNENKGDSKKTYKQFLKEDNKESEREISKVIKNAKIVIDNNGSLENLYKQVDNITQKH